MRLGNVYKYISNSLHLHRNDVRCIAPLQTIFIDKNGKMTIKKY